MKAVEFEGSNCIYAEDQEEYLNLPAFKNNAGDVLSCWEPNDEELETINKTKRVYLFQKTFNQALQPACLTVENLALDEQ